jgi:hypothetical protein
VAVLAQVLTAGSSAGVTGNRSAAMALLGAALIALAIAASLIAHGLVRAAVASVTTASLVFWLVKQGQASRERRRRAVRDELLYALALQLPGDWYLLSDLTLSPSWGVTINVWAVVVAPGGVAVLHTCDAAGEVHPMGHVWLVRQGRTARVIPSPAAICWGAAEALKECMPFEGVSVRPAVVLTDTASIYYPVRTGAPVVGAPHAAGAIRQLLAGNRLAPSDVARLAADLCRFYR